MNFTMNLSGAEKAQIEKALGEAKKAQIEKADKGMIRAFVRHES